VDADIFIGGAFVAGLLSFFSPCLLPLVPVYLMYLGSTSGAGRARIFLNACAFVIGFALVFTFFGVGVGVLGDALAPYLANIRFISVIILVVLGLSMLEVFNFSPPWANTLLRMPSSIKNPLLVSFIVGIIFAFAWTPCVGLMPSSIKNPLLVSFIVGIIFAFAWTPCVGLILGYILTLAFMFDDWQMSTLLLGVYSAGLGIPFLLVAVFFDRVTALKRVNRYLPLLKKAAGVVLIVFAVLIQLDLLSKLIGLIAFE